MNVVIDGVKYVPADSVYEDARTQVEELKGDLQTIKEMLRSHHTRFRESIFACKINGFDQFKMLNEFHLLNLEELLINDLAFVNDTFRDLCNELKIGEA